MSGSWKASWVGLAALALWGALGAGCAGDPEPGPVGPDALEILVLDLAEDPLELADFLARAPGPVAAVTAAVLLYHGDREGAEAVLAAPDVSTLEDARRFAAARGLRAVTAATGYSEIVRLVKSGVPVIILAGAVVTPLVVHGYDFNRRTFTRTDERGIPRDVPTDEIARGQDQAGHRSLIIFRPEQIAEMRNRGVELEGLAE